jgi:hypothetical protein
VPRNDSTQSQISDEFGTSTFFLKQFFGGLAGVSITGDE